MSLKNKIGTGVLLLGLAGVSSSIYNIVSATQEQRNLGNEVQQYFQIQTELNKSITINELLDPDKLNYYKDLKEKQSLINQKFHQQIEQYGTYDGDILSCVYLYFGSVIPIAVGGAILLGPYFTRRKKK